MQIATSIFASSSARPRPMSAHDEHRRRQADRYGVNSRRGALLRKWKGGKP